jgi:hypothetical protein
MKYLSLMAILIPVLAQAETNCQKNPIYCNILKLKPNVNLKFAKDLSNSIYKYSKMFGTDPIISVAIAMQESSFENKNRMGSVITKAGYVVNGATDLGVFQLHVNTISNLQNEGHDLDVQRLKNDVDYQAYWHAKILKKKIATCKSQRERLQVKSGDEWSCYHSFTLDKRNIYLNSVNTHLNKLKDL